MGRRRWIGLWPIPAMLVAVVLLQAVWFSRYDVTGHAAEHLGSATAIFGIAFLLGVVLWAVPPRVRRRPDLWLLVGVVLLGAVGVAAGNLRVVEAIGTEDWSYELAEVLGPSRAGFEDGHTLAQWSALLAAAGALLLAVWLWWRGAIGPWPCIVAVGLDVLVPYFVFPGAGLLVLAVALVVTRFRATAPTLAPA